MRKKFLFASAAVLLCFCHLTTAFADEITLNINGSPLTTDVSARIIDGRVMVPVRAIFEAVGAEVQWDPDMKDITGTKGERTVIMRVDSIIERINGVEYEMDVMPVISGGRTLAPARYVAEAFGYSVYWDAETETVDIVGGETASESEDSVNSMGIDNELFNNVKDVFEGYIEKISDCTTDDATQAVIDEFYDENSFFGLADYSDYYYNT
ncbi:MAG: copper amine oxidase N-terminal domain-containing protein, partial [Clostridiales bacterium]|nr:copper amine oxidase N-terminal domain-containing protein [Clostridiales bacterium]